MLQDDLEIFIFDSNQDSDPRGQYFHNLSIAKEISHWIRNPRFKAKQPLSKPWNFG